MFTSASMRMVMFQNVAMALFFMGSYIVTMPLLVREVYDGSAHDLAFMNGANSLGLVVTILLLLRLGDVRRQGRALLLSQGIGALVWHCRRPKTCPTPTAATSPNKPDRGWRHSTRCRPVRWLNRLPTPCRE